MRVQHKDRSHEIIKDPKAYYVKTWERARKTVAEEMRRDKERQDAR